MLEAPAKEVHYPWSRFKKDVMALAERVKSESQGFDVIVAITRGGLIPSYFFAKVLGVETILTLGLEHYDCVNKVLPELRIYQPLPEDHRLSLKRKRVLIVDEVVETGRTAKRAVEEVLRYTDQVSLAVVSYKPRRLGVPLPAVPFYYAHRTSAWIVYPWETWL